MTIKACAVCNGTGLAYDRTEFRMVPCGGICCTVKGTDMTIKQVIVMRKDLSMRKGKMCAQAAHASMAFITKRLTCHETYGTYDQHSVVLSEVQQQWLDESFIKICVSVDSEQELLDLYELVSTQSDIVAHLVQDNGLTEFDGVPTYTCVAIGPDFADKIDPFTSHLRLL